MGNLLAYSGITTKIRGMESKLISDEMYRDISQLTSVPQVVSYLKSLPGYRDLWKDLDENQLHRGQVESMLGATLYQSFTRIYRFANLKQREYLDLYLKRYKVSIIKKCITHIFDHREADLDLSYYHDFFVKHSKIPYDQMENILTMEELVGSLKDSEYYNCLNDILKKEDATLFDYEMAIDLYRIRNTWDLIHNAIPKEDQKNFIVIYGNKFDLLNIQWILRAKRYYHMQNVDIYAMLIPVQYKLKNEEIRAMVEAESVDAFYDEMKKTYYGHHYEELTLDNMEEFYVSISKHLLGSLSRKDPYSLITLYSYLYNKEHEMERLIVALECIRYGIGPEETYSLIMKT